MKTGYREAISTLSDREMLEEFQESYFPDKPFEYHTTQRVGTGYDCTIGGQRVEIKNDLKSKDTGNLFIETRQTFDGWKTEQLSGLNLCLTQDVALFVVVAYMEQESFFLWAPPQEWRELCRNRRLGETKKGKNGNRPDSYAKGFIIPLSEIL